jgi:uncharacterized surface protein with fasciclin (FAS1) repeats
MLMKRALTLVAGAALALTLAACGSGSTTATSTTSAAADAGSASMSAPMTSAMSSDPMSSGAGASGSADAMPATLVGPGCADYAAANPSGGGSVEGMAKDTVTTAASNNPLLTSLVAAVSGKVNTEVNLVNTLNNGEFTVFAPVDTAFAKIDAATMTKLSDPANADMLSGILTYHVVPGKLSPSEVVGVHPTANGGTVTVTGSGDNLKVNDASVICGGVQTKNATVYLIDTVLTPPAAG